MSANVYNPSKFTPQPPSSGTLIQDLECVQNLVWKGNADGAFRGSSDKLLEFVKPEAQKDRTHPGARGAMIYARDIPDLIKVSHES